MPESSRYAKQDKSTRAGKMGGAEEEAESKFLSGFFFFVCVILALSFPLKSSCASWTSY